MTLYTDLIKRVREYLGLYNKVCRKDTQVRINVQGVADKTDDGYYRERHYQRVVVDAHNILPIHNITTDMARALLHIDDVLNSEELRNDIYFSIEAILAEDKDYSLTDATDEVITVIKHKIGGE